MRDVSSQSPEKRAERGEESWRQGPLFKEGWTVLKRLAIGIFDNGFMYAGNLAYLALLTVFPFFILAAAIAAIFGQSHEAAQAVASFLATLPPDVADILRKPIADVLAARTGSLLWLGAVVALWSVGSFIETIRDIFRRAYGVASTRPFWQYRLWSMAVIVLSVLVALFSFLVQGAMIASEQFIYNLAPWAKEAAGWIGVSRIVPGVVMYGALYFTFLSVTPRKFRARGCPKWPGALFTTLWWVSATALLPVVLANLRNFDLTYGSLAGVIITLIFFYIIGLGISIGAHLNAALAEGPFDAVEDPKTTATETVAA